MMLDNDAVYSGIPVGGAMVSVIQRLRVVWPQNFDWERMILLPAVPFGFPSKRSMIGLPKAFYTIYHDKSTLSSDQENKIPCLLTRGVVDSVPLANSS